MSKSLKYPDFVVGYKLVRLRKEGKRQIKTPLFKLSPEYKCGELLQMGDEPCYGFATLEHATAWIPQAQQVAKNRGITPFNIAIFKIKYHPEVNNGLIKPVAVSHTGCRRGNKRPSEIMSEMWDLFNCLDVESLSDLMGDGYVRRAPEGTVLFNRFIMLQSVPMKIIPPKSGNQK